MGDIPAGWLAVLSPAVIGAVSGIGFWFKYLIGELKEERTENKRLTAVIADMQAKTVAALTLQLEASLRRSTSDMSVARALSDQTKVIESKVGTP